MKSSCKIYSFLRAVRGNWRNAIFVSCDCGNCMCGRTTPCSGFLLAVDECGQVMLLSAEDIQRLSGETVDGENALHQCGGPKEGSAILGKQSNGGRESIPQHLAIDNLRVRETSCSGVDYIVAF